MDISHNEALKQAASIQKSFICNHMILYVGCGISDEEISQQILDLRWSCVITSRTDTEFSSLFSNSTRIPREYYENDIPSKPLNRKNLPILRLFGIDGAEISNYQEDMMMELGFWESGKRKANEKFLNLLPSILDCVNQMIVIGYDALNDKELPIETLAQHIVRAGEKSVKFFGMAGQQDVRIQKLANAKKFPYYLDSLTDIFHTLPKESISDDVPVEFQQSENIFFKDGDAVSISDIALQRTRHFAILLSEQEVNSIRPYGRIQMQNYFMNFLTLTSVEKPQWYGYRDNTHFYLDRPYGKSLHYLITTMLKTGNLPQMSSTTAPIILQGAPGSSKSVIMGAVAYQIYQAHEYPVIFIKNEGLTLSAGSEELDELNLLMATLQKAGNKDTKVLIFWDCSSYRNVLSNVKGLVRELENRGRRFVLVCTSYIHDSGENRNYYTLKDDIKFSFMNDCYFVDADRWIDDIEKNKLHQLFQRYSGISSEMLSLWWKRLEGEANGDIFYYFYKLISLLREPLKNGLSREQRIVGKYVRKKLEKISEGYVKAKKEQGNNIFALAGIDLTELGLPGTVEEDFDDLDNEYDLDRFNICIALFGQFKISTPYSLAMKMLTSEYTSMPVYSAERRELFQLLTTQIPWIHYGSQNGDDDFMFSFRNTLEAELFLEENNVSIEKQVEVICDFIKIYGMDYNENGYLDESLKNSIQLLLHLIGPNTDYQEFAATAKRGEEHRQILRNMEKIIDSLSELRLKYKIPDEDGSFLNLEVTFMREYYGTKWDEIYGYKNTDYRWVELPKLYDKKHYEQRLKELEEAIHLAVKKLESIEMFLNMHLEYLDRKRMCERRNSLVNEMVLCNLAAEDAQSQYRECCWHHNQAVAEEWRAPRFVLPYRDIFKRMQKVIDSDPANGHYYNTLMKIFEKEYLRSNLSEHQKMEYLSEMNMVIDPIDSGEIPDIINRGPNGNDELGNHIARVRQWSAHYTVMIEDIENRHEGLDAFYRMYDQMMETNNPTAILFVCRQELGKLNVLQQRDILDDGQKEICIRVAKFMLQEENYRCIETRPMALAMLIRIVWMESSGMPLSNLREVNLVSMPVNSWKRIQNLCSHYEEMSNGVERPSIMLIYALSVLQVTGDYQQSAEILRRIKEKDFYSATRMRVPYIYCNEENKPHKFSGRVINVKGNSGFIHVNGIPLKLGAQYGIKFRNLNLGYSAISSLPKEGDVISDLELGIGYTGFALYKEEGRKSKAGV